ncbi:MAG: PAS domain S-box protein [Deltaproteobacteria bacterium]|nr:PAS domain S-box protein [Deltaproteobacteria bacterium]
MSDDERLEIERLVTALRESEVRARAVVETAVDGIVTTDEAGNIDSFNPAAERLFGYRAAEVVGRNVSLLTSGSLRNTDGTLMREVAGRRKDGTSIPLELSVSEFEANGRRMFTAFVRDVSQRRRDEAALHASQDRFDTFMKHLPGVAFMKDLEGRYVYVSPAFEQHFPKPRGGFIGRSDTEVWPPDAIQRLRASDQTVVETRGVVQTTETVARPEGTTFWLASKFPIFSADGSVGMVGGIAIDVTACHRALQALRELQRIAPQRERLADVGAITAKILHDFANPLAGLSMQVQLILRRATRDPSQTLESIIQPVTQILSEVTRLDAMLGELKEFVRDQRLQLRPVSLRPFLQDCVDRWRPTARSNDIALALEAPRELPVVHVDSEKLRRVIDNLVKNAIEALDSQSGKITVRSSQPAPETVQICVEDDGPGIAEGLELFRLFETTKPYGTGLGLAIAKQIIQAHGGSIAHVPAKPRGSIFRLDLQRGGPHTLAGDMGAPGGR